MSVLNFETIFLKNFEIKNFYNLFFEKKFLYHKVTLHLIQQFKIINTNTINQINSKLILFGNFVFKKNVRQKIMIN